MEEQGLKCLKESRLKFISKVKSVQKFVLVNGDIKNYKDYKSSLKQSKADGVMIGRGTYGKPWIFEEIRFVTRKGSFVASSKKMYNIETL